MTSGCFSSYSACYCVLLSLILVRRRHSSGVPFQFLPCDEYHSRSVGHQLGDRVILCQILSVLYEARLCASGCLVYGTGR